uniref:Large ribosomal subunit protein bL20c n=1 Tax=Ligustrum japonicum TaxID=46072 RepID=A0A4D5Y9S6_LIGJA|nr:ribosomal protein L20 [Ligustrum japonicum]QBS52327.1 ribosomal protein L20 [Ligustrum japonicum]
MTRIKRGYIARRRRTKTHLFASSSRGAHSKLTRTITQQKIRALVSADRDRDKQKRNFRRLWITRINAVIREKGVSYNYSKLIHDLYKRQLLLNRKILAQIAISNRNCLYMISNEIIKEVERIHRNSFNGVPRRMNSGKREGRVEITMSKYAKIVKMNEHIQ